MSCRIPGHSKQYTTGMICLNKTVLIPEKNARFSHAMALGYTQHMGIHNFFIYLKT